jgi:cobalt-zinc-cadmium efflux system outer membrane protein
VKLWPIIFLVALLAGCARFQNKPISAEKTAAELESRSLTNDALRIFLEKNLHREFANWPDTNWNFESLTLAAFYYQPNLDVARAQWQSAQAGIQTAGARPNPSISAAAAYNSDVPSISPWMPSISFDVPIETAGKRARRIEQARHLSDSAKFNIATAAWQTRSELRGALLDAISGQKRVELLAQQVALQENLRKKLQQQFQAGAISSAETFPAGVALARSRADLADAQSQLAEARVRIATAIGLPVSALDGIHFDFDLAENFATEKLTSADARRAALLGRADIRSALADYAAAQSALQLEIAKQYPDVHLSPGYAWNQNQIGDNQWQLGLTVDLPLLNQNQGPIAEAEARRNELAAKFLALQSKVIGEIDRALALLDAAKKNLEAIHALAETQARQRESVENQFKAGAVEQIDLLGAQIEFQSATLAELDARVKFQQAIGALEDAVQRPISGSVNSETVFANVKK